MLASILIRPAFKIATFVVTCIIYLVAAFAAYGGRFNTDFFTLPAIMVLVLPYMAIITAVTAALCLVCKQYIAGALGVLTLICCWAPVSKASPIAFEKSAPAGSKCFTLMTWNILHAQDRTNPDNKDFNPAINYLINSHADIVCLQELVKWNDTEVSAFTKSLEDSLRKAYPYMVGSNQLDMKLLSKYPAKYIDADKYIDEDFDRRRYTFYEVNIDGRLLTVVNLHLMSYRLSEEERHVVSGLRSMSGVKDSIEEFKGSMYEKMHAAFKKRKRDAEILRRALDKISGPVVVCGDFNDVPESYAYRIIVGDDFKDAYAHTGFGPLITFNAHAFWFHLDQILYRGPLEALSVEKGTLKCSDHYPLTATFALTRER